MVVYPNGIGVCVNIWGDLGIFKEVVGGVDGFQCVFV